MKNMDEEEDLKRLRKKFKDLDDLEEEGKDLDNDDPLEVAYTPDGGKSWHKKEFEDEEKRCKFIKLLRSKGFDDEEIMTRGGKELDPLENNDLALAGKDLTDEEKEKVEEVKAFFKDLAEENSELDQDKRLKAFSHGKDMDEIAGDVVDDPAMVEKCFGRHMRKSIPGSPEWQAEEAAEPEHKGWHKDDDEVDKDEKDLSEEEQEEKRLKALRKDLLDGEDPNAVKRLCKAAAKFLKMLGYEKAFGRLHRAKAAFFKDMIDPLVEETKGCDCGGAECTECAAKDMDGSMDEVPADVLEKDIDFEPGEMGEKRLNRAQKMFAHASKVTGDLLTKLTSLTR